MSVAHWWAAQLTSTMLISEGPSEMCIRGSGCSGLHTGVLDVVKQQYEALKRDITDVHTDLLMLWCPSVWRPSAGRGVSRRELLREMIDQVRRETSPPTFFSLHHAPAKDGSLEETSSPLSSPLTEGRGSTPSWRRVPFLTTPNHAHLRPPLQPRSVPPPLLHLHHRKFTQLWLNSCESKVGIIKFSKR